MNKAPAIILLLLFFLHGFALKALPEETYSITANVTDMGKMCYITGTVKDTKGNAVYPAKVTFEGCSIKTTVETLPGGYFIFNPPPCLDYSITACTLSGESTTRDAVIEADEVKSVELTISELRYLKEAICVLGLLTGNPCDETPRDHTNDGKIGIEDAILALQMAAADPVDTQQKIYFRMKLGAATKAQARVGKDSEGDGVYDEDWSHKANIDEYGNLEVNDIPNGTYSIEITSPDNQSAVRVEHIKVAGRTVHIKSVSLKPLGQIAGNVQLEGAEDHSNINITIPGTSLSALSDANGYFVISSIPEGTYDVMLSRASFGTVTLEDIPVQSDNETTIDEVTLASTVASLHGTAQLAGETDNTGNLVILKASTGNSFVTTTITDGAYDFIDLPIGEYNISITPVTQLHSSYSTVVTLKQGENNIDPVTLPLLRAEETGTLFGTVQLDYESEDYGGVLVSVMGSRFMAVADSSGHYEMAGIPEGEYTVCMDREGFVAHKEENVQVTGGQEIQLDALLSLQITEDGSTHCGSIMGTASYSDLVSAEGIAIKIEGTDIPLAGTDTNGAYMINNVPPGTYTVTFTQANYKTVTRTGVIVPPWNTVELEPVIMIPPVGEISGKVELEGQTAHNNVTIALDGTDIDAQTSSDGLFILMKIPAGAYTLTAYREGFERVEIPDVQVIAGRRTILEDTIVLKAAPDAPTGVNAEYISNTSVKVEWAASVSGDVAGYDIYYGSAPDQLNTRANTELVASQVEGIWTYTVENLTEGEIYFSVKAVDLDGLESGFAVPASPPSMGSISGTIQLEDVDEGGDHSGVNVSVDGTSVSAITSTDGTFILSPLPAGSYTIRVSKAGYVTGTVSEDVVSGQTTALSSSIILKAPPVAPTGVTAAYVAEGEIQVNWSASASGDLAGYNVYYGPAADNLGTKANTELIIDTVYTVTGLSEGIFWFSVKTIDKDGLESGFASPSSPDPMGSISGTIQLEDVAEGGDHSGVTVSVDGTSVNAITSTDGTFILSPLPAGSYTIRVSKAGYVTGTISEDVVSGQTTTLSSSVVLKAFPAFPTGVTATYIDEGQVQVNWTESASNDVAGYDIYYGTGPDQINIKANTDLVTGVVYTVTDLSEGMSWFSVKAIDNDGLESGLAAPATPDPMGTMTGTIRLEGVDEAGDHSGVTVSLDGTSMSAVTSSDGVFIMSPIPAGSYTVRVSKDGFVTETLSEAVDFGQTTTLSSTVVLKAPPVAPTGVTAAYIAEGEVRVNWSASVSGDVAGYDVYYGPAADSLSTKGNTELVTGLVYTVTGLSEGTYWFSVKTIDNDGLESGFATPTTPNPMGAISGTIQLEDVDEGGDHSGVEVSVDGTSVSAITSTDGAFILSPLPAGSYTIRASKYGFVTETLSKAVISGQTTTLSSTVVLKAPPVAPTGVTAAYIAEGEVQVIWTASVSTDVAGYDVYYGTASDQLLTKANADLITDTIYTVTGLSEGIYWFSVKAIDNDSLESSLAAPATPDPMGSITGTIRLEGVAENGDHSNATVSVDGTSVSAVTSTNGTFTLSPLPAGNYSIQCSKAGYVTSTFTESVVSGQTTIISSNIVLKSPPAAPSGVTAVYVAAGQVKVNWTASVSVDVAGYDVYYGSASDQLNTKANTELTTGATYTVTGLSEGTYWFSVKALDNDNLESGLATPSSPPAMGEIEGLAQAEGTSDHSNITVSLEGASINAQTIASGYYLLSPVPPGTYTVSAYKAGYSTARLEGVVVNPGQKTSLFASTLIVAAPPEPPTGLGASQTSGSSIKVTWTASISTDVTGYNVYYGIESSNITTQSNQALITSKVNDIWQYEVTGLQKGVTYYFATKAKDDDALYSALSQYVQKAIIPGQPVPPAPSEILEGGYLFRYPEQICISRDGSHGYVTNPLNNVVSIIDMHTESVIGTIPVGLYPSDVVSNPQRDEVYCVNTDGSSVTIINSLEDESSAAVIGTLNTSTNPNRAYVSPDGKYLFVSCVYAGSYCVNIIDLDTRAKITESPVTVGNDPAGMAIAANKLYVVSEGENNLSVIDIMEGSPTRWQRKAYNIPVGDSPLDVVARPDGLYIYVTNTGDDTVSIIDTGTDQVVATLTVGDYPYGLAAYEYMLYITNYNSGAVSMINTESNQVLGSTVSVGNYPEGIVVSEDGEKIYVVNYGSESVSIRKY